MIFNIQVLIFTSSLNILAIAKLLVTTKIKDNSSWTLFLSGSVMRVYCNKTAIIQM